MIEDIETEARTLSRSALRHRPIAPDATQSQVQTPRASRTRQKPKPYSPDDLAFAEPSPTHTSTRARKASRSWVIHLLLGVLVALLLLMIGLTLWIWGHTVSDDLHYGRPRTTQVDHVVGHEAGNTATHFIAINMSGQIYVVEIPGGKPNGSRLLVGPHLIGPNADLAPVALSFVGDPQHPDLVIVVSGIEAKFHNTGSEYVPV